MSNSTSTGSNGFYSANYSPSTNSAKFYSGSNSASASELWETARPAPAKAPKPSASELWETARPAPAKAAKPKRGKKHAAPTTHLKDRRAESSREALFVTARTAPYVPLRKRAPANEDAAQNSASGSGSSPYVADCLLDESLGIYPGDHSQSDNQFGLESTVKRDGSLATGRNDPFEYYGQAETTSTAPADDLAASTRYVMYCLRRDGALTDNTPEGTRKAPPIPPRKSRQNYDNVLTQSSRLGFSAGGTLADSLASTDSDMGDSLASTGSDMGDFLASTGSDMGDFLGESLKYVVDDPSAVDPQNVLLTAIRKKDRDLLQQALELGANLNATDPSQLNAEEQNILNLFILIYNGVDLTESVRTDSHVDVLAASFRAGFTLADSLASTGSDMGDSLGGSLKYVVDDPSVADPQVVLLTAICKKDSALLDQALALGAKLNKVDSSQLNEGEINILKFLILAQERAELHPYDGGAPLLITDPGSHAHRSVSVTGNALNGIRTAAAKAHRSGENGNS